MTQHRSGPDDLTPDQWKRVDAILAEVTTHPPDAWASEARALTRDDDAVHEAVMTRLAAFSEAHTADVAVDPSAPTIAPQRDGAGRNGHPTGAPVIPGYRMLDQIGAGGMGVVWRAEQIDPQRVVAVKVIRPGVASGNLLARFRLEANVLGRLVHSGIARIYEAGTAETDAGPQPYFVMEHVDGMTLNEYVDRHAMGTRRRLELIARICDAVHHAHQKGVIHRDLKPGNILVTDDDTTTATDHTRTGLSGVGQPKILDFGVARLTDADVQSATMQTDVGQLIGTLPYMSPEQATGDPDDLDTRSDVYTLGVVAYELLAGELPYDVRKRMITEVVRVIREDEPLPLSSHDRDYRGDIETIFAKALDKDKNRRYPSATDLAADIRRYLHDEPIVARPASTAYQLTKFAKRNRALVGGVASAFMVLVIGVIATSLATARAHAAERVADDERAIAEEQRDAAEHARSFLVDTLEQMSPQLRGPDVTVATVFREREPAIDHTPPLVRIALHEMYGRVYRSLGMRDQSVDHLSSAVDLGEHELDEDANWFASILGWYGSALLDVGRDRDAAQQFLRAQTLSGAAAVAPQAGLYTNWAFSLHDLGDYDASEFTSRRALSVLGDTETVETAQIKNLLVWLAVDRGALDDAEALSADARAIAARQETGPQFDAFVSLTHGYLLHAQGNLDAALDAYRASRNQFIDAAQDDRTPPAERTRLFIKGLIEDAGTLDQPLDATAAERAWSAPDGVLTRRDRALLLRNRARILIRHNAPDAGFSLFARSVEVDEGHEDEAAERLAHTHREWSRYLRDHGDLNAARTHAETAERLLRTRLTGDLAVALAPVLLERGRIDLAQNRIREGCRAIDEAIAERHRHFATNDWPLAMTGAHRAECLLALGRPDAAIEVLTSATTIVEHALGPDNDRTRTLRARLAEIR